MQHLCLQIVYSINPFWDKLAIRALPRYCRAFRPLPDPAVGADIDRLCVLRSNKFEKCRKEQAAFEEKVPPTAVQQ